ncbi:hypothetical protein GLYMA_U031508v4 [Glycine max]|nr:hypothetical protein GLYMA_U031508v4 [Glycine max]KAH1134873.1 hypothetical protein GYH30_012940 [Glycine max]
MLFRMKVTFRSLNICFEFRSLQLQQVSDMDSSDHSYPSNNQQSDSWWEGNPSAKNKKCLIPYSTRIWGIRARLRSASKVIGTRRNICEDLLPDFRFRMFSNRSRIPSNTS